jgi:hypothetical protein
MSFAHVWLISPIGHVYAELELEVPTERVQVESSANLDFESRQALVYLTTILEFIYSSCILFMILGCVLSYKS